MEQYPDIARGAALCIPIYLLDDFKEPIRSPRYAICFTLKNHLYDFDYTDKFALIQKYAQIVDLDKGWYEIRLSSAETWLPPDDYYFELTISPESEPQNKVRLALYQVKISGGPENKFISKISPTGFFKGDPLCFAAYQPIPFNVIFSNYGSNSTQLPLTSEPEYLLETKGFTKKIKAYGPRLEFPVTIDSALSDTPIQATIESFFPYDLGKDFIFKNGLITIKGNILSISAIPNDSKAFFITGDGYQIQYPPYQFEYTMNQQIFIRIVHENQTLDIKGYKAGTLWALTFTWFDLTKN